MATELRRAIERGELPMITICERPDGFPDEYVVAHASRVAEPGMTGLLLRSASLDALREMLPPGLHRLPRQPGDEAAIVEAWL
jgi:hypothetical protein